MSSGLYSHTTRSVGTILTAAIYNGDHQNHINNHNPSMMGGYSDNVAEMQLVSDPGGVGTESLPGSLAGELERMRFAIKRIVGGAQWYSAPTQTLEDIQTIADRSPNFRVRAATTANITTTTALNSGDTIDGVVLANGDLVLVKDQTTASQNGIYVVGAVPARHSQFDAYDDHPGILIVVMEGTVNADSLWVCTSQLGGTLGTTAIAYSDVKDLLDNFTADTGVAVGTKGLVPAPAVGDANRGFMLSVNGWDSPKIVEIKSSFKDTVFTHNATGYTAITGLSVTITPKRTANKIALFATGIYGGASGLTGSFRFSRNAVPIGVGEAAGTRAQAGTAVTPAATDFHCPWTLMYVDSPSSVAALTYTVQMRVSINGQDGFVGRSSLNTDSSELSRAATVLIAAEIVEA